MSLLLIHLAVADLLVILLQVPLEIAWTATVSWKAGDLFCRIMVFFRILGFYASGFIMIVISLDRLSAIMFPLSHISSSSRTKLMLTIAWIVAPLCSLPQSFIFSVKSHPMEPDYLQCTTIGSFEEEISELCYFIFVFSLTWLLPLLVMLMSYLAIFVIIYRRTQQF